MKKPDGRALDHKTREAIRIRAVQQVQRGESPEEVIKALGYNRRCIYQWLAAYRDGGWDGLKTGRITGRPRKMGEREMRWIYKTIANKNPMQLKFEFALWTRDMVRVLIRRRFGIRLSLASVGRLLGQLGFTCQKPLMKAFQQNVTLVQKWLEEDYPKIEKAAKKEGADILFSDESGVRSDFHSGTTWGLRGKTPVVFATGQRFSLNMISAVSRKGALRFMVVKGSVGAHVFIEFLKRLIKGARRKIFLIVDGHPSHRAKITRAFVESVANKISLYFLPPYSPELNPDEHVWNDVKNNSVGRRVVKTQDDLRKAITGRLVYLQRNPERVRGFFLAPTTKYAA